MPLGVSDDVLNTLKAAQEVARSQNIPSVVHEPNAVPAPQPEAAEPAAPAKVAPAQQGRGPRPARKRRVGVDLPLYAIEQIRQLAFKNDCTKRQIILNALNEGGINIKPVDLQEPAADE